MREKILANKTILIFCVAVVLVLAGILISALTRNDSEKEGKPSVSIGTDKDSEEAENDTDGVNNGAGLEVEDTLDESAYMIDGSGGWDGTTDNHDKTNNASSDDKLSDDKQSDNNKKEEDDKKDEDAHEELDNDILVDDKVWGDIN